MKSQFQFIEIMQKEKLNLYRNQQGLKKGIEKSVLFLFARHGRALTGASPERARIVVSGWQAYGENGIYECTFRDIENSATGGKK